MRQSLTLGSTVIALILLAYCPSRGASPTPLQLSGFNRDVMIENTATGPPYTNYASNFNAGENTCFYQTNLPSKTNGLPLTGRFTNSLDGSVFQLQAYTASNAL